MEPKRSLMHALVWSTALLGLGVSGCDRQPATTAPGTGRHRPTVVASIYPLASLAQQLIGEDARVVTLLSPGDTEHGVELTPAQTVVLTETDLLLIVGMGLDEWAVRAANNAGRTDLPVFRFESVLTPEELPAAHPGPPERGEQGQIEAGEHEHDHADGRGHSDERHLTHVGGGGANPHVWLDPVLAERYVAALADRLIDLCPDHQDAIAQRAGRLRAEIRQIDQEYRTQTDSMPQKNLITFHNAFDRLTDRYSLRVVVHLTEIDLTPGGEVTPARLVEAIDAITSYRLKVVYAEPQFPDAAVRALQQQTGVRVLRLDPLGAPGVPGYDSYQAMMRSNLAALVQGQSDPLLSQ
jgi:ABC-type Zn uptake system ZnuABC Zn-binding protein ZnuA